MLQLYWGDNMVVKEKLPKLNIDKHLPQIILPAKTRAMFLNWWNTDIRFEQSIPKIFNSGYMILNYNYMEREQEILDNSKNNIKMIARHYKSTYRQAENMIKDLIYCFSKFTIYFKFISDNAISTEIYNNKNDLMFTMDFAVGKSEPEPEILSDDILHLVLDADNLHMQYDMEQPLEPVVKTLLSQLVTAMWYIATTKSTKYIYENKTPVITGRKKNIVQVSNTKTINTPIYDLNKIRVVKVEHLQTRKKGWTYSHSFQVHGHYRHYRNGKVVFIQSYIKGKDKEFKAQQIILDPKNDSERNIAETNK